MTSLMENFEEWAHLRHPQPAPAITPQEQRMSAITDARNLIGRFAHEASDVLPVLEAAAANPHIDALVEAALAAANAGVADEVFIAVADMLRAAGQRRAQAPHPAPQVMA